MENNEKQVNNETTVKPEKTDLQKAKAKSWITLAGGFGIAVLLFIVGGVLGEIGGFLLALGFIFLMFLPLWFVMIRANIRRVHCQQCGTKYNYDSDVEWVVEDETIKGSTDTQGVRRETRKANVAFSCKCHRCGMIKNFNKKFVTGTYNSKEGLKTYDLENECRKYFKL